MPNNDDSNDSLNLMPGDIVEVRSREEILASLDENGELENLPFMPEMLRFCGRRMPVSRRADKTCDTIDNEGSMRMRNAVHFKDVRCDGSSHGGCQAECLLFWKERWLKKVDDATPDSNREAPRDQAGGCTEATLQRATNGYSSAEDGKKRLRYFCQATELKRATVPLPWWDVRQYVRDVRTGNTSVAGLIKAGLFACYRELVHLGFGYNQLIRIYDWFQDRIGGQRFPFRAGKAPGTTPAAELGLKVGEYVRVRSHEEILETLNQNSRNRGLWFDAEMVPHCGKVYRVASRVDRIIHEKTGEMVHFKNPCIILENVYCVGRFTQKRLFCPRSIQSYWREIWLERTASEES